VVNSWLLYRRTADSKKVLLKDQLSLLDFTLKVADSLMRAGKHIISSIKRGRPSSSSLASTSETLNTINSSGKRPALKRSSPFDAIRFDSIDHLPRFHEKQQKCAFKITGAYSFFYLINYENELMCF
jgi:hypothetical protein